MSYAEQVLVLINIMFVPSEILCRITVLSNSEKRLLYNADYDLFLFSQYFVGNKWHLFLPMSVCLPTGFESTVLLIPNSYLCQKRKRRVQSTSLQQSFSIRNDKLFDWSLSVPLQRTGLLNFTFDCRDCKPSLREFSQSYFFPHSRTGSHSVLPTCYRSLEIPLTQS